MRNLILVVILLTLAFMAASQGGGRPSPPSDYKFAQSYKFDRLYITPKGHRLRIIMIMILYNDTIDIQVIFSRLEKGDTYGDGQDNSTKFTEEGTSKKSYSILGLADQYYEKAHQIANDRYDSPPASQEQSSQASHPASSAQLSSASPPATSVSPPATSVSPPATSVSPLPTSVSPPATSVSPPATSVSPLKSPITGGGFLFRPHGGIPINPKIPESAIFDNSYTTPKGNRLRIIMTIIIYRQSIDIWIIFARLTKNGGQVGNGQDFLQKLTEEKIANKTYQFTDLSDQYFKKAYQIADDRYDTPEAVNKP